MNLHRLLARRLEAGRPVRVGLIGAGKFGSMFLAQVPSTPGSRSRRSPTSTRTARARPAGASAGPSERIARDRASPTTAARDAARRRTSRSWSRRPATRRRHRAMRCARDRRRASTSSWSTSRPTCWPGRCWRTRRASAGVVYSLAYGDQPALICELVDWARAAGFEVVAAGKGTKYLPDYHDVHAGHGLGALRADARSRREPAA